VDAVLRGNADTVLGGVDPTRARELLTQRAVQTHAEPRPMLAYVALNTRTSPFDDVRVRRALNYGIDRRAVVRAIGGHAVGRPTCQVLPPNIPGYVRTCPYGAPDIRAARRLVAASGTAGMRITLRTLPVLRDPARPVVALLDHLGYRASLKVISGARTFFHEISDSRVHAQAGMLQWYADYPTPSNFLELLSCDAFAAADPINNQNFAEFCDAEIDEQMRAAAATEPPNTQLANRRWARVDRAIVAAAPWVPLYNANSVELVSRRVGGFRFNPVYGPLLDQLWVR
jgi:peptide/nickel transport system substrate-binding protein